jgi:shikimate kinase
MKKNNIMYHKINKGTQKEKRRIMNLVLIGYRGAGKSTVGRQLAARLGMQYVSTDSEITKRAAMSIPDIVEKSGWNFFRDLEAEITREVTLQDGLVIDTGGGVIERRENVANLQNNSQIFWLKASVETVVARIQDGHSRPALTDGKTFTDEVADVLAKREPLYHAAADHEIETTSLKPGQIVDLIIEKWSK